MKKLIVFLILINIAVIAVFLYLTGQLSWFYILFSVLFYILSSSVHLIVHECGHLILGLMSGYKLLFIQFGPLRMFSDSNHKIKFENAHTLSSQCVMIPPDTYPVKYKLYNLGGIIANLFAVALSFLLLLFHSSVVTLFMVELVCVGIQKVIVNVVPLKNGQSLNDGYTIGLLGKNDAVRKDYVNYMRLYSRLARNEKINPKEYSYERKISDDNDQMLYYNEIQSILKSI